MDTHNEWEIHKKQIRDEYRTAILSANHEVDADMALYNALDKALTFCEAALRKEWAGKAKELLAEYPITGHSVGQFEYEINWANPIAHEVINKLCALIEPDSSN